MKRNIAFKNFFNLMNYTKYYSLGFMVYTFMQCRAIPLDFKKKLSK